MEILDTGFDMDAYEMKKHMFTVTTMTPKLCDALQVVEAMFEEDRRHWWTSYLAADVLNTLCAGNNHGSIPCAEYPS